jgi:addiction module RelE/StbE family toxin
MYSIEFTNKYITDLKRARKRKFNENELNKVIKHLSTSDVPLPQKYADHALTGKLKGFREIAI